MSALVCRSLTGALYVTGLDIWLTGFHSSPLGCRPRHYLFIYVEMLNIWDNLVRMLGYFPLERLLI